MNIRENFKTKLLNLREASGTYRAGYKYDPVEKKTAPNGTKTWDQTATKNLDKPQSAGQERGVRSLSNTLSADGKKSTSMHDVIKDKVVRPDKNDGTGGDYDVSTKKTFTSTSMKEENLNELKGYRGNQRLLGKVFKRATERAAATAWRKPKDAKRHSETAANAWDRFDNKNK